LGRPVCRDRTDRRNRAAQGALGPPDVSREDGRPVAGVGEDAERDPAGAVADEAVRLLEGGGDVVPPAGDLDLLGDFGFPRRSAAGGAAGRFVDRGHKTSLGELDVWETSFPRGVVQSLQLRALAPKWSGKREPQ
jgi:hypothetical protein